MRFELFKETSTFYAAYKQYLLRHELSGEPDELIDRLIEANSGNERKETRQ